MPIPTYYLKDLLIDFMIDLPILTDWKSDSYNVILIIIDCLSKIVYYELVKIRINAAGLAKIIIIMVVRYYGIYESIMSD